MNETKSLSSELKQFSVRNYGCSESVNQMKEIEGCMEKIGLTHTPHTPALCDASLSLIHSGSNSTFRTALADVRNSQSLSLDGKSHSRKEVERVNCPEKFLQYPGPIKGRKREEKPCVPSHRQTLDGYPR